MLIKNQQVLNMNKYEIKTAILKELSVFLPKLKNLPFSAHIRIRFYTNQLQVGKAAEQ